MAPTDETHIIRTIEYWDIEKSRYPQYEHYAVLVAEDITSRFLNVIALFNKAIPLIAIEMRALEVGGLLTLHATKVFDAIPLGTDEEDEAGQPTDRDYWVKRGGKASVQAADQMLVLVNEVTGRWLALKYNKHYIGLAQDGIADNFVTFRARKDYLIAEFRIPRSEEVDALVEESGADTMGYDKRWGRYRLRLKPAGEIDKYRDQLVELIERASGTTPPPSED